MGAVETTIREQASSLSSQPSEETARTEKVRFVVPEAKGNETNSTDGQKEEGPERNSLPLAGTNKEAISRSIKDSRDSTLTTTAVEKPKINSATPSATSSATSSATPSATSSATPSATSSATSAKALATSASSEPSTTTAPSETSTTAAKSISAATTAASKSSFVDKFLSRSPKPEAKTSKPTARAQPPSKPMEDATNTQMWQSIIDNSMIGTRVFTHVAICGLETGRIYACNPHNFDPTIAQVLLLGQAVHRPGLIAEKGIQVDNQKFLYRSGTIGLAMYGVDPEIDDRGIVVVIGSSSMIIGVYGKNAKQAKRVMLELLEYFISQNDF